MGNALVPELYCTDIDRSLAFYTGVLGFHVRYARPEEGFAYLEREGAELMLDRLASGPAVAGSRTWLAGPIAHPFGRGINLQIRVADVDGLHRAARAAGTTIFLEMEEKWYRAGTHEVGNRQFILLDPDGYLLRFYQDLGRRPLVA
ncbi:catechol 2,3-dioxygenase-like lactoylglutathione lyase family enzyme [Stella humosa]|uniref:Bleomycin resistance protein n=1 Tax=Stella humosa TaxID=94 RepID=A0A3N1LHF7_9PROT|nr:VOC family protein [Stella humosa]ROP90690.1 catechol 2,3-dioxygenase-like lactoylglutathione lyase family enzyme [Stella humosa]BBK29410.1 glyoxalase [Stella humosa]